MPPSALPVTPAAADRINASRNVIPAPCAYAVTLLIDVSPTPRFGVLTTRRQLTSSSGFTSARR